MTTDKDIQVLEEMRGNREALARIYSSGTSAFSKEREERDQTELTALSNILSDFRDMRKEVDRLYHVHANDCCSCTDVMEKLIHSDAWREVKGEK